MKSETLTAFEQAEEEFERANFGPAFDLYLRFMIDWLATTDPSLAAAEVLTAREMVALERLADLAALFGQSDKAFDILTLTKNLFEQAGNRSAAAYLVLKLVSLEFNRGFIRQARQQLRQMPIVNDELGEIEFTEEGFTLWEGQRRWPEVSVADRRVFFSRFYLELGRLEAATGEYQRALAALKRGIVHCRSNAPRLAQRAIAPLILAIARAELEQGDLPSTEVALSSLPASLDPLSQTVVAGQRLEIAGKVALLRGKLGAARDQFERALKLCEAEGLEQAAALAKLNLAQVLIYLNHTAEASEFLDRVRETGRSLNDGALLMRAESLLRHARARGQSLAGTVPITESLIDLWDVADEPPAHPSPIDQANPFDIPIAGNYLALFEDRALGFHWLLSRQDWPAARRYLDEINEVFSTSDSLLIRVRLFVMGCMLDYYAGEHQEAARGFQEAGPILRQMGLLPELWQAQRFLSWSLVKTDRLREAELMRQEAEATLASLAASLDAADQAIFMLNKWTAGEEYISGEIDRLARLKASIINSSRIRRPFLRWQLIKRLGALLDYVDRYKDTLAQREVKAQRAAQGTGSKPTLWRRLLGHPRDRLTISFVVLPDRVLMARFGWMSLDFGVSSMTRIQVRELVRRWHAQSLQGDETSAREAGRVMRIFEKSLQLDELLEESPARIRHLTFVPDDSLHGLPFAAMSFKGRYLVESYALSLSFEWSGRRSPESTVGEALGVAVTNALEEFPALRGARGELDGAQQWLKRRKVPVRVLANGEAEKSALLRLLPEASLFHIACHGIFKPNRPDCSGLVLVPRHTAEVVSLRELSRLPLSKLRQAILSACWSADSFALPGRWIISLPETLWRAGAHSILGCLWEVEDGLAGPFMMQFYENLEKLPRDEALRRVQLDCIGRKLKGCQLIGISDPIYWAGFTLYGDSGPLNLS